jgi:SAM-dependent methyltransferase
LYAFYEPGIRRLPLAGIEFETGVEFTPGKPLPFKEGTFDCVLLCDVLEHVIDHPLHVFAEVHRILGEHGLMVVTSPNICNFYNRMMLLSGRNPQTFLHEVKYGSLSGTGHFREYTIGEVQWLLQKTMFRIMEARLVDTVSPFGSVAHSLKLRLLYHPYRVIKWMWPSLRDTIAIVAEKA